jgi:pyruvate/2-oxoglutarate dehydrogenase complex dihydrolipoamide dehydrogenase (E3) component
MPEVEHFDVVILGSGQGGKQLAWRLGKSGKKVAVVERRWVGGSCPAVACMPSKNELWSAHVAHTLQNAASFGTWSARLKPTCARCTGARRSWSNLKLRSICGPIRNRCQFIMGSVRFVGPKTIEVSLNDGGARTLAGNEIVLNLGSHAAIPDVPGL